MNEKDFIGMAKAAMNGIICMMNTDRLAMDREWIAQQAWAIASQMRSVGREYLPDSKQEE